MDAAELKAKAVETFETLDEVQRRFEPGTHGHHELTDRAWITFENFQSYCDAHPANLFIKGAPELSEKIAELMHDYYQLVACAEESVADASTTGNNRTIAATDSGQCC